MTKFQLSAMIKALEKVLRKRSTSAAPSERIFHRLKEYPGECGWKVAFELESGSRRVEILCAVAKTGAAQASHTV